MSDQPGSREPSDGPGADQYGQGRDDAGRAGDGRAGSPWPRPGTPGTDVFGELQRWFIRQSARSMRRELSGQVRRTLGGGGKPEATDVWDTATTEIPPEVGESPECQWCPVCRAARRMRDAGPGLGGQISGAGDAVASAVQDAIGVLDSLLARAGGAASGSREAREQEPREPSGTRPPAGTGKTGESSAAGGQDPWSSPGSPPTNGGNDGGAANAQSGEDPWQAAAGTEPAGQDDKNSDPADRTDRDPNGTDDRG